MRARQPACGAGLGAGGGAAEEGLRLAAALWRFWSIRGYLSEGRGWLEAALATGGMAPAAARAAALNGAGGIAFEQGEYGSAAAFHAAALALRGELGDRQGLAQSLNNLGVAVAYGQGDLERAAALLGESLALLRELGDSYGIAFCLQGLGLLAHRQGDLERAAALLGESLALQRDLGDTSGTVYALNGLGLVATGRGEYGRARALYQESLRLSRAIGARGYVAEALEGMAWGAAGCGQPEQAARLGGAAEALREALGGPLAPEQREGHEQAVQAMRAALGESAFAGAWATGHSLSPEQAVAEALSGGPRGYV